MEGDTEEVRTRSRVAAVARAARQSRDAVDAGTGPRRGKAGGRAAADGHGTDPRASTPKRGRSGRAPERSRVGPTVDGRTAGGGVGEEEASSHAGKDARAAGAPPYDRGGATAREQAPASPSPLTTPAAAPEGEASHSPAALLAPQPLRVMEFSVSPAELRGALAALLPVVPARTALPVLQHLRVVSDGPSHVRVTATDLDTTATLRVPAKVAVPGTALVPGRKLSEIAREIPDGCRLHLRLDEDVLVVRSRATRTRYRLPARDADDFPVLPEVAGPDDGWEVPAGVLETLVERTAYAASQEETRPILNGVLWEVADGETGMVATDGHRLALCRCALPGAVARAPVILHPRALRLAARLSAPEETVHVARGPSHVVLRGKGWDMVARVIEGPYPPYERVVPAAQDRALVVDHGALTAALRRIALLATGQTHRVRLSMGGDPHALRISVATPDLGSAHEDVDVAYEGAPLEIGFNAVYLLELLRYLPVGDLRLAFRAPGTAALVTPVATEDDEPRSQVVLMPVRLQ